MNGPAYSETGGEVIGFWGLARPEMAYEVHIGGRRRYAWCAWDTLFIPELLDTEVRVEATTGIEQRPVQLVVTPSEAEITAGNISELFVSFNLPDDEGWEQNVASSFCHHVHFLMAGEVEPWLDQNPGGFVLTLTEAFDAGKGKNVHQFGSRLDESNKQQAVVGGR